jgi:hypothetical protein
MSGKQRCFLPAKECKFVLDIVDSINKLLAFVNPGKFGQIVLRYVAFQSKAEQKDTIKLELDAYVMYIYKKAFKEQFPTENRTQEQIDKINAIWDAIGHPEKKISS